MVDADPPNLGKPEVLETGSSELQDGMLQYFLSQVALSDAHIEELLAKSPFDCRDELNIKKR